jgi:hypothetical protein
MIKLLLILSIIFNLQLSYAATYYIDLSDSGSSNNGTWAEPYNSIATLNGLSPSTGDDFYFKSGITHVLTTGWNVNWDGSSGDHAVIGCASAEGVFTCSDEDRPVLDGSNKTIPSGTYDAMIYVNGHDYVDVKDLYSKDSGALAFYFRYADHCSIDNCRIYNSVSNAIMISKCNYTDATNCVFQRIKKNTSTTGAAIEISGGDTAGSCTHCWVRGCIGWDSEHEGIGLYSKTDSCGIENCIVWDVESFHVYVAHSKDATVRSCTVYRSSTSAYNVTALFSQNEESAKAYCYTGPTRFYGNIGVAGGYGINIGCSWGQSDSGCYWPYTYVFNNVFIDNTAANVRLWPNDFNTGTNLNFFNNVFWLVDENDQVISTTVTGDHWDNNNFYGGSGISGDPANGALTASAPGLVKTSGFLTMIAGSVSRASFLPSSDSSYVVDKGIAHATVTAGTTGTTVSVDRGYVFAGDETVSVDSGDNGTSDFTDTLTANGATSITFSSSHTFSTGDTITIVMDDVNGDIPSNPWGGVYLDVGALELSSESPNPGPPITIVNRIDPSYPPVRIDPSYPMVRISH